MVSEQSIFQLGEFIKVQCDRKINIAGVAVLVWKMQLISNRPDDYEIRPQYPAMVLKCP